MTIAQWLEPVSGSDPCGPALDYDPAFLVLDESVRVQPAQEFRRDDGATIGVEPAETRWPAVLEQSQELLARSKDLRLAVLLTRALLHTEGFAAIATGLELIRRLLQDYWDGLHPRLDPDDGDPTMRLNALAALNSVDSVLGDLRASLIIDSRQHGSLRVRELEIAQGRLEPLEGEVGPAPVQLQGLLAAVQQQSPQIAGRATAALEDLEALLGWLGERVGTAALPDLSGLKGMLQLVAAALDRQAGSQPAGQVSAAGDEMALPPSISQDIPIINVPGSIHCRGDVVKLLEILCQYLEINEPTNPVQILLKRAQRMMNMNFLELMQDMAPDGLEQAEKVVGQKLGNDDD
jgi:type VI secretion system protein ImpA